MPIQNADEKAADEGFEITILCQGERSEGGPYWAYLALKPSRVKPFVKARDSGALRLEDFGSIIEWGEGADVPAEVKERMEREHGMSHQLNDNLIKVLKEQQKLQKRGPAPRPRPTKR